MSKIITVKVCLEKANKTTKTKKPFYPLFSSTGLILICIHFRRINLDVYVKDIF